MENTNTGVIATPKIEKVIYTGKTRTTGGREGFAKSSDGHLDIELTSPGSKGTGTNPEQLLAAGWSACFIGAIGIAANKAKVKLPEDFYVDAEVDLGVTGVEYFLGARLNVHLPGIDTEVAEMLVATAHKTCPYSKALHNSIDITTNLI
jgi:Ohr subfamily peroxiredoxin